MPRIIPAEGPIERVGEEQPNRGAQREGCGQGLATRAGGGVHLHLGGLPSAHLGGVGGVPALSLVLEGLVHHAVAHQDGNVQLRKAYKRIE